MGFFSSLFGGRKDTRLTLIAQHVLELSRSNLEMIESEMTSDSVEGLVEACSDDIRNDVFETYDTKVVAMAVLLHIANNALQFGEIKTSCMLALSVIWAGAKMIEEVYSLTTKEREYVSILEAEARYLLAENHQSVDVITAKLWIAATLSSPTYVTK